ncbi:hypothetical protein GPY51_14990 [Photorhabdus laumondii subsp. laumondii]|uniref:DUF3168 domain-containing protein n=1 Tax=Photorhabdus laumondii subsp. laumondii TaxID=141679 RepID=A0A6L9JLJ2_PHOLM|nr:hypothetical protein [Photorhabdus laumondii]MCC8385148.1 hypothetical protein [Photorhabdus laumondii]MCC8413915.1 hypothetical protein [Photorhabdus laumondii]NDK92719.1 hypothetical protein [Photorhabdus laumondii subsp. laumondii]NDL19945.1 hypothetical protein [Photorhabdus laumondii subsp. laumondii]NDL30855.1 hypothetical protein [Photorhabdus laumondii subsp. laumondii]
MIEYDIKASLEETTGLPAYPLLLPDNIQEGVTYQRISDPKFDTGLAITSLVNARFQIAIYLIDDYARLLELDKTVIRTWESITHGYIGQYPVQAITRGVLHQDKTDLTKGRVQYRITRDFIICYSEDPYDQG